MDNQETDSTPVLSRTERKKLANTAPATPIGVTKKVMAVGGMVAVAGMILAGFIGYKVGQVNEDSRFVATVSSSLEFEDQVFPEGWDNKLSERDKGTQFSKRNPLPATFDGCTYSRMTTFLPSHKAGKGSKYLSQELAYEYAESLGVQSPSTSVQKIKLDGKSTGAIQLSWDNRVIMVRAFDSKETQKVPKDLKSSPPQGIATVTDEGFPAVVLDYSCGEKGNYDQNTAQEMFESTNIISQNSDNT